MKLIENGEEPKGLFDTRESESREAVRRAAFLKLPAHTQRARYIVAAFREIEGGFWFKVGRRRVIKNPILEGDDVVYEDMDSWPHCDVIFLEDEALLAVSMNKDSPNEFIVANSIRRWLSEDPNITPRFDVTLLRLYSNVRLLEIVKEAQKINQLTIPIIGSNSGDTQGLVLATAKVLDKLRANSGRVVYSGGEQGLDREATAQVATEAINQGNAPAVQYTQGGLKQTYQTKQHEQREPMLLPAPKDAASVANIARAVRQRYSQESDEKGDGDE